MLSRARAPKRSRGFNYDDMVIRQQYSPTHQKFTSVQGSAFRHTSKTLGFIPRAMCGPPPLGKSPVWVWILWSSPPA